MYLGNLQNSSEFQGQRSRSQVLCVFLACMINTVWTSQSGFSKWHSLNGTTLLLPAEANVTIRGQYLVHEQGLTILFLLFFLELKAI